MPSKVKARRRAHSSAEEKEFQRQCENRKRAKRPLLTIDKAVAEVMRDRWQCVTCSGPAEEDSKYCRHCSSYWGDVSDGMFDDLDHDLSIIVA